MKRLVVGLTGTFGSGKSSVGRLLKSYGAKVVDADRVVDEVYRPTHPIAKRIKALFGTTDRKRLAQKVFGQDGQRRQLESLIHPYVWERFRKEVVRARGVIVLEVPLLFETGFDRICDLTVAVVAGEKNILKRTRKPTRAKSQAHARMRAQWPEQKKKKKADLFIDNSGTKKDLVRSTRALWMILNTVKKS